MTHDIMFERTEAGNPITMNPHAIAKVVSTETEYSKVELISLLTIEACHHSMFRKDLNLMEYLTTALDISVHRIIVLLDELQEIGILEYNYIEDTNELKMKQILPWYY